MKTPFLSHLHLQTCRDGVVSRRMFLRASAASGLAGASLVTQSGSGVIGFKEALAAEADTLRKRGMACILLFMTGAPSQFECFDPKPGTPTGGPTKDIATAVPGVRIAEGWEKTATQFKEIALIRSMTNTVAEHIRAQYMLHTGVVPTAAAKYPCFGSVVASRLGPSDFDLPHFVSIGNSARSIGAGFLGQSYAPFVVSDPNDLPTNSELPAGVNVERFRRRTGLREDLEADFAAAGARQLVEDHAATYRNAAKLVLSPRLKTFDVSAEPDAVRDRYGRTPFGQGCLLARRLVEAGVTFVEVELANWDTHFDNFDRIKPLRDACDPAFAALVADLKSRGLLEKTLVIWMGEFGRTPLINARAGRDHYPRAFTVAMAGAGVKGGAVVGSTSADGSTVKDRPVSVADLFCTFCHALKIDPRHENSGPLGRPIKIVDGGNPVKELFS